MRLLTLGCILLVACSGNDVDPRVIPGGGIGDGEIDGEVNVYVIDGDTREPIVNATVGVGAGTTTVDDTTDETGLVVVGDVEGPQTISVKADGYTSVVWVGANGANVTVPMTKLDSSAPDQATLSGSIADWDTITVAQGHIKAAAVFFSQTDDLGDAANNIQTPNNGNICGVGTATCDWTLVSRTGSLTVVAAIVDRDGKGTPADPNDDTQEIIGWAIKHGVTVEQGVNQSGLVLDIVEAGNLETVSVDYGTPPAGLTERAGLIGIELADDEVIQIPLFVISTDATSALVPKRTMFGADATYRFTAIAQTAQADDGAQSFVIERGQTDTTITASQWLTPPTGVTATRTGASWDAVDGAKLHQIQWQDATGDTVLQISMFDGTQTSVDVPALVSLPTSGALTARVSALGADLDLQDFSLDDDDDLLWGLSGQPAPAIE